MARGRMLSKSFSTSKRRGTLIDRCGDPCPHCGGSLAEFAQTLYQLLLPHSDDFGRQEGDAFTVKHKVDPLSRRPMGDFIRALAQLEEAELIQWFAGVEGPDAPVISIVDFELHQSGLQKRTTSKFPEPSGTSRKFQGIPPELNLTELKGRELKKYARTRATSSRGRKERPKVSVLSAMVTREVLPLRLSDPEAIIEAAKARAAALHLAYDSATILKAIKSATAQAQKGARV